MSDAAPTPSETAAPELVEIPSLVARELADLAKVTDDRQHVMVRYLGVALQKHLDDAGLRKFSAPPYIADIRRIISAGQRFRNAIDKCRFFTAEIARPSTVGSVHHVELDFIDQRQRVSQWLNDYETFLGMCQATNKPAHRHPIGPWDSRGERLAARCYLAAHLAGGQLRVNPDRTGAEGFRDIGGTFPRFVEIVSSGLPRRSEKAPASLSVLRRIKKQVLDKYPASMSELFS